MPKGLDGNYLTAVQSMSVKPIILIEIQWAVGTQRIAVWDVDVTWAGETWYARGALLESIDTQADLTVPSINIQVDNTDEIMSGHIEANEDTAVGTPFIIRRVEADTLGSVDYVDVLFEGEIHSYTTTRSETNFEVHGTLRVVDKQTTGQFFTAECLWLFGGQFCTFDVGAASSACTADAGSTATVVIDAAVLTQANDHWANGVVVFTAGALAGQTRQIVSSNQGAKSVTVEYPFSAAPGVGDAFTVKPGCRKTVDDCEKHSNLSNYSGFHCIPTTRRLD